MYEYLYRKIRGSKRPLSYIDIVKKNKAQLKASDFDMAPDGKTIYLPATSVWVNPRSSDYVRNRKKNSWATRLILQQEKAKK